ncbi:hypothetical protein K435DRAFT_861169 [Dendrothele bispora CBS 962.96]|uniref:Uncharacterized protein n=1 Tax=Dendrothele bispora (strain CBS 962.96) TaxID=1314807 RepID=A0A4S8LWL4_DENBC|nr:hypothetical protein K435DRAFT_861169 [Dendrothele bispora CBS 962.96]
MDADCSFPGSIDDILGLTSVAEERDVEFEVTVRPGSPEVEMADGTQETEIDSNDPSQTSPTSDDEPGSTLTSNPRTAPSPSSTTGIPPQNRTIITGNSLPTQLSFTALSTPSTYRPFFAPPPTLTVAVPSPSSTYSPAPSSPSSVLMTPVTNRGLIRPPSPSPTTDRSMRGQSRQSFNNRQINCVSPSPSVSSPSVSKSKGKQPEMSPSPTEGHRRALKKSSSVPGPLYPSSSRLAPGSGSETALDSRHRLERNVVLVENDVQTCQSDLRQLQDRLNGVSDALAMALNRTLDQQGALLNAIASLTRDDHISPSPAIDGEVVATTVIPTQTQTQTLNSSGDTAGLADVPGPSLTDSAGTGGPTIVDSPPSYRTRPRPVNVVVRHPRGGRPALLGRLSAPPGANSSLLNRLSTSPESLLDRLSPCPDTPQLLSTSSALPSSQSAGSSAVNKRKRPVTSDDSDNVDDSTPRKSLKSNALVMNRSPSAGIAVLLGPHPDAHRRFPTHFRDFRPILNRWIDLAESALRTSQPGLSFPRPTRSRVVHSRNYLELSFDSTEASDWFIAAWTAYSHGIHDARGVTANRLAGSA